MYRSFDEFLHDLQQTRANHRRLQQRIHEAASACCNVTTNFDRVGHGGGGGDARDGPIAALADLLDEQKRSWKELQLELYRIEWLAVMLDRRGFYREAVILRWRYGRDDPWCDVETALRNNDFDPGSARTLYRWHRIALDEARKLWEEQHGIKKKDSSEDR